MGQGKGEKERPTERGLNREAGRREINMKIKVMKGLEGASWKE